MKKIIAVCDEERAYLYSMQEYFEKHPFMDFAFKIFDHPADVEKYGEIHEITFLLLHEKWKDYPWKTLQVKEQYLLCEKQATGPTEIAKYQSMESIKIKILQGYESQNESYLFRSASEKQGKFITFFSLMQNERMSIYAMAYAQMMANQGKKVLYLNLQPYSGLWNTESLPKHDLSDFILYTQKHQENLQIKLECVKEKINQLDILPPMKNYEDLQEMSKQEWREFIRLFIQETSYEYIVVDCCTNTRGFMEFLHHSEKCMTEKPLTRYEQNVFQNFSDFLEKKECNQILDQLIQIPFEKKLFEREYAIDRLGVSEIGRYMEAWIA